jgi:protoporphyrinogen oxidase
MNIAKKGNEFALTYQKADSKPKTETYDVVISTLPTSVIGFVTADLFPASYLKQLKSLEYLFAANLILETKQPLLDSTYWLSICVPKMPMMVAVQHTNFMNKENYANNHILYIGNYIEKDSVILKMDLQESIKYFLPHLSRINPAFKVNSDKAYLFKAPFAQPIFDKNFIKNKPDFETPVKNFYMANLDMTYPYDRGTNFAVKLGKDVAAML